MKKVLAMIALGAICLGPVSAAVHVTAIQDTVKKKMRDTTKMKYKRRKVKKDSVKM